jgi:hypothetical protein
MRRFWNSTSHTREWQAQVSGLSVSRNNRNPEWEQMFFILALDLLSFSSRQPREELTILQARFRSIIANGKISIEL